MKAVSSEKSLSTIGTLLPYAIRRWQSLLALALTTLLVAFVSLLRPWPMQFIIDQALVGRPVPEGMQTLVGGWLSLDTRSAQLGWAVAGTILIFIVGWVAQLFHSLAQLAFGQRMVCDLSSDLYGHLQKLSLRYHAMRATGDTIRRVTSDCSCVSGIVRDALLPAFSSAITLLSMMLIMWRLDPWLTMLAVAVVPPLTLVLRRYAGPMSTRSYEQQEAEAQIYNDVERTFSSIVAVQLFRRERLNDVEFRGHTDGALAASLVTTDVQLKFKVLVGLCTAVGTGSIIYVGARHVMAGTMTFGTLTVFLAYLASLYRPIEAIVYSSFAVHGATGSARRVVEVLQTERDVMDRPGAIDVPAIRGSVSFDKVSFQYLEDRDVLRNVSLEIEAGETVAIVGATGAGKSTLLSLIPRFIDASKGTVRIDGVDVRDFTLQSLRQNVSIVPQESFLFPISVADNIAYGRPAASRNEVIEAARAANAHEFIDLMPEGYDTVVGERGVTLSGGQRQRIAIARALLRNSPILILDEPTSGLDASTEAMVLQALGRLMRGRTTLVIAHRLSTVRNADRIVVLDSGAIVEQGKHLELIHRGGHYARMCAASESRGDAVETGVWS